MPAPIPNDERSSTLRARRAAVTMAEVRREVERRVGGPVGDDDVVAGLRAVQAVDAAEESVQKWAVGQAALNALIDFLDERETESAR